MLIPVMLLASLALAGCGSVFGSATVTGITLNDDVFPLLIDDSVRLIATITPSAASNAAIMWTSSAETVATVDENGLVKGIAAGEAIITATTIDGRVKAECGVRVAPGISVSDIALNKVNHSMRVYESFQFTATVEPDYAYNPEITWTSSDPLVAILLENESGKVVALKAGTATIKAATANGKFAECVITVTE